MEQRCGTCRFCEDVDLLAPASGDHTFWCRRLPPVRLLGDVEPDRRTSVPCDPAMGIWPEVNPRHDWCGEWREAEPDAALTAEPLDVLDLSIRSDRALKDGRFGQAKIFTVGELIRQSADELLGRRNFGTHSLAEVREKLAAVGLKLRGEQGGE